ncbi:MAG: hypothetical protein ACI80I_002275, partial [Akkermansiaceae bacterium]
QGRRKDNCNNERRHTGLSKIQFSAQAALLSGAKLLKSNSATRTLSQAFTQKTRLASRPLDGATGASKTIFD